MTGKALELWQFREVIKNFVAQDLKVKYRRSALGFFWSLMNPLLQMIVMSIVFSLMFKIPNLSLYILSGSVGWTFFASTVDACAISIIGAESMLKRQYFPKLVFPLSTVLQNLITFALSLLVLLALVGPFCGFRLSPALLILPVSFICMACFTLGVGALAAVATVHFRDMQHLITVFLSALFFLTPVIYPLDDKTVHLPPAAHAEPGVVEVADRSTTATGPIPFEYRKYFKVNPLFSLLSMFQRPIYDRMLPTPTEMTAAIGTSLASLGIGLLVFRRFENGLIFRL